MVKGISEVRETGLFSFDMLSIILTMLQLTGYISNEGRTIQSQGRAVSRLNKSSCLGAVGLKGVVTQN